MPALLFAQDKEWVLTMFKLGNMTRICMDDLSGEVRGIVAIFKQDNFGRGTKRIRQRYEVRVGGENCKAVLSGVIPDLPIGGTAAEADLRDMNRAGKEIMNCFEQAAGKIFVQKELHSA